MDVEVCNYMLQLRWCNYFRFLQPYCYFGYCSMSQLHVDTFWENDPKFRLAVGIVLLSVVLLKISTSGLASQTRVTYISRNTTDISGYAHPRRHFILVPSLSKIPDLPLNFNVMCCSSRVITISGFGSHVATSGCCSVSQPHVNPCWEFVLVEKCQVCHRNCTDICHTVGNISTSGKHASKTIAYSCIDCPFTTSADAE